MKRRHSKKFRLLVEDLRYWQTRYRIESRGVAEIKKKIKKIAKEMRDEISNQSLKPISTRRINLKIIKIESAPFYYVSEDDEK